MPAGRREEERVRRKEKKQGHYEHFIFFCAFEIVSQSFFTNILQNGSSSTREAALPQKSKPEPFLEEPESCQIDSKLKFP